MIRDFNELIEHGSAAQMEKLRAPKNAQKGGFEDVTIDYALSRMLDEWVELRSAIRGGGRPEAIRHEAADVANFAHMIILNCDRQIEKAS